MQCLNANLFKFQLFFYIKYERKKNIYIKSLFIKSKRMKLNVLFYFFFETLMMLKFDIELSNWK